MGFFAYAPPAPQLGSQAKCLDGGKRAGRKFMPDCEKMMIRRELCCFNMRALFVKKRYILKTNIELNLFKKTYNCSMIIQERQRFLVDKIKEFIQLQLSNNEAFNLLKENEPLLAFDVVLREDGRPPYFQQDEEGNLKPVESAELDSQLINSQHIFDVLGFFRWTTKDRVYLCPHNILFYCARKFNHPDFWKDELQLVTEIVFIHECAHWIHYALNPHDFKRGSENYIETWAQLCTKRICIELGARHCQVFARMLENQAYKYKCFADYQDMPLKTVLKFFLLQQSPSNDSIDIVALHAFREKEESIKKLEDNLLGDLNTLGFPDPWSEPIIDQDRYNKLIQPK